MGSIIRRTDQGLWRLRQKYGRLGVTGAFAVSALILILLVGWLVDQRGASSADKKLANLARSTKGDPIELVVRAARAHRLLFLSDIHNSAVTKRFAAQAIARISELSGLDALVIEVGADQQQYIDQYLDRAPEDASVLLAHPRTLREPGAATRDYLEIYRTVWRLNQRLGADQRIRIIAADLPGWPATRAASPSETARKMADREEHMATTIQSTILNSIPDARIVVFMTGMHALKSGAVVLETGGTTPVRVDPLASRLAASTEEVYTILVDAPSAGLAGREVAPYTGTRIASILAETGVSKRFAAVVGPEFNYLRRPLLEKKAPGLEFSITPRDYHLSDVADAYIHFGN